MTDVPDSLKTHNWSFYEGAMSADPAIACQYIVKLLISLQITMKSAEVYEFDELLNHEMLGARRAWYEYSSLKNPGLGMQTVGNVLVNVGFLLYDSRFANQQARAFTGRSDK